MANRVLMGKGTTARGGTDKYGLWISIPGQDVTSCTDDQLIFNTDKGGTGDIKALFQTQTVDTSNTSAQTAVTATVSAGATTNVSFSNLNFGFGVAAFGGLGFATNSAGNTVVSGRIQINSTSTGQINVTNLNSASAQTISFIVMPQHGAALY